MEIVGKLKQDAKLETLKDERKVIHFSLTVNDSYRPKAGDVVKLTNFFNCSYWKNENLAGHLKKGTLFHVNAIKLHGRLNREEAPAMESIVANH